MLFHRVALDRPFTFSLEREQRIEKTVLALLLPLISLSLSSKFRKREPSNFISRDFGIDAQSHVPIPVRGTHSKLVYGVKARRPAISTRVSKLLFRN